MHEVFDHTADIGLRIRAKTLEELFNEAGRAFTAVVVENPEAVRPAEECRFEIPGRERDYLLFDWLNELLYRFDTHRQLFSRFDMHVSEEGLQGSAWGETVDPARHHLTHEVKAITYHHLRVEQTVDGWQAEVILDI